jgi:hypothetical protein
MKKKFKLRNYSILVVAIMLVIAVGVTVVKAQSSDSDILDKVITILGMTNGNKQDAIVGYSDRPGDVVVTKVINYNDITTTGVNIINQVTGDFYLENLIVESNDKSIASGTLFKIVKSTDTYGASSTVFSMQVNYLATSTSWDLNSPVVATNCGTSVTIAKQNVINHGQNCAMASTTQRVVLEDGSTLKAFCTGASCMRTTNGNESGTGYLRITSILKRADTYSSTFE